MNPALQSHINALVESTTANEIAADALRYRVTKNLPPQDFLTIWSRASCGASFDDIIDEMILKEKK